MEEYGTYMLEFTGEGDGVMGSIRLTKFYNGYDLLVGDQMYYMGSDHLEKQNHAYDHDNVFRHRFKVCFVLTVHCLYC